MNIRYFGNIYRQNFFLIQKGDVYKQVYSLFYKYVETAKRDRTPRNVHQIMTLNY